MKPNNYDILDTEIRIIGDTSPTPRPKLRWLWWVIAFVIVCIIGAIILLHPQEESDNGTIFEPNPTNTTQTHPLSTWVHSLDEIQTVGTATKDTTVNDIPMRIFVPLNCTPRLEVGYDCIDDTAKNILLFQAADIRADNLKIVGAFVLRGQPLSWGLSKKGYCGIIDNQVSIGVADNSPLFELATEKGGYFFRQYPLVSNGYLVENELKSQSTRRGLCELEGRVAVVETFTPESLHDFAQALVDLGVTNAIYLVGSSSIGWCKTLDGVGTPSGLWEPRIYENVSFIVWE